jgi:hypothetical protein
LSEDNEDIWTHHGKAFKALVSMNIATFDVINSTKYQQTGGFRLNQTGNYEFSAQGGYSITGDHKPKYKWMDWKDGE